MAGIVVAQFTPGFYQRRAIARDIDVMPGETAFRHCQTAARPIDLQCLDALRGMDGKACLNAVVDS
jgi:hypothetical protein